MRYFVAKSMPRWVGSSTTAAVLGGADHSLQDAIDVRMHASSCFRRADFAETQAFEDVDEAIPHARMLEIPALAHVMRQGRDLRVAVPSERVREAFGFEHG